MQLPQVLALAEQHQQAGNLPMAEQLCRQVLEAQPRQSQALHLLGIIAHRAGDTAAGIDLIRQAIGIDGGVALYHSNLGEMCRLTGRTDEAVAAGRRALALDPTMVNALNNLGIAHYDRGEYREALGCYQRAIALGPETAETHSNLGNALRALRDIDAAVAAYNRAVRLNPNYADGWANLGSSLVLVGRREQARFSYQRALAIHPQQANAHSGLALILLQQGDYPAGWAEYEWRWPASETPVQRPSGPEWRGEDLRGRRLLVYAEQGYGDTLQFCRYASILRDRGATVVLRIPPALGPLVAESMPWAEVSWDGATAAPPYDLHCATLSVPHVLGTTVETIPGEVAYLQAPAAAAARWRERLAAYEGLKVGVVWAGNPKHLNDQNRSIPLALLAPLFRVPGVTLFSLQVGERAGDLAEAAAPIVDLAPSLTDYAETAGAMANLDLVIAVDTSVVHLAGAMARPTWTLVSAVSDWRWLLDREETPWYPTMRLFRQPRTGAWPAVVERVAAELALVAAGERHRLAPPPSASSSNGELSP
jgi:tetratricopeptide (TPR) repeat protein